MGLFGLFGKKKETPKTPDQIFQEGMNAFNANDFAKALPLLKQAAELGNPVAPCLIGVMFSNGQGVEKNDAEALEWFLISAQRGFDSAQFNCAAFYKNGVGTRPDLEKAKMWCKKAAEKGNKNAIELLKELEPEKAGSPCDGEDEFDKILGEIDEELAQTKEADRLSSEAVAAGKAGDHVRELKLYLRAAELGSAAAMCNCGQMYDVGEGTPVDKAKAFYWFEKAAQLGDVSAQYNCGNACYNGSGTAKDLARAFYWYEKAAQQGHAKSQFNCGILYSNGKVTPPDKEKALQWYTKAAEQGHAGAQLNLGVMYFDGDGTERDLAKAHYWYKKAAEQGHAGAQFNLGLMYERGNGVTADRDKARQWLGKAAAQGYEDAKNMLEKLDAREKEEAEAQARREQAAREKQERYAKAMTLYRAGNYDEAFPLLEKVCIAFGRYKREYPDAWVAKGWMYENGKGTEARPDEAYRCYRIAAQNGERDGKAGMVRLAVGKDGISVEDCQTALGYVKELNDGRLNALVPALEKKLAEAQLRESMADWELTEKNVQALYECCYNEDTNEWNEEAIKENGQKIRYLLGQLLSVHEGNYEPLIFLLGQRYDNSFWVKDESFDLVIKLLNLGIAVGCVGAPKTDETHEDHIAVLKRDDISSTLSPKDPNFDVWYKRFAPYFEALEECRNKNFTKALSLFEKAAEQGYANAQFCCGVMYDNGEGTEKDEAKALYWYEKAAEQGEVRAQFNCGNMYGRGGGTPVDKTKALYWYEKAAEQGYADAQLICGMIYDIGNGTAVNRAKALYWYEKAAEQGMYDAQFFCAEFYRKGMGTAVDETKALYWYEKAAEQGVAKAQFNCGVIYFNGDGVAKDKAKAKMWLQKAADQGLQEAKDILKKYF